MSSQLAGISHRTISTNGIKMHIAEQGSGPVVLLLHGFPEFWFSWRHQIPVLAEAGYHAVAPDLRGYGETDAPPEAEKYTVFHIAGDLIGLLDALGVDKAFVVGHDWGAFYAYNLCLFRPDRVEALISLSVHYVPRSPDCSLLEGIRSVLGEGYYMCRFQDPGRAEADFARHSCTSVMKKFLLYSVPGPIIAPPDKEISDVLEEKETIPPWISEDEIFYYAKQFEKSGFTGGLNYYRSINLSWELLAPWTGAPVLVPTLFIVGDQDIVYHMPGAKQHIHEGGMKAGVPNLKDTILLEGVHHFLQQEKPEVVNNHMLNFLKMYST